MKKLFLIGSLATAILIIMAFAYQSDKAVKHIVVFKYKSTATPAQIDQVTSAFLDLTNKIPAQLARVCNACAIKKLSFIVNPRYSF